MHLCLLVTSNGGFGQLFDLPLSVSFAVRFLVFEALFGDGTSFSGVLVLRCKMHCFGYKSCARCQNTGISVPVFHKYLFCMSGVLVLWCKMWCLGYYFYDLGEGY